MRGQMSGLPGWKSVLRNLCVLVAIIVLLKVTWNVPSPSIGIIKSWSSWQQGSISKFNRTSIDLGAAPAAESPQDKKRRKSDDQWAARPCQTLAAGDMTPEEALKVDEETRELDFEDRDFQLPPTFLSLEPPTDGTLTVARPMKPTSRNVPRSFYVEPNALENWKEPFDFFLPPAVHEALEKAKSDDNFTTALDQSENERESESGSGDGVDVAKQVDVILPRTVVGRPFVTSDWYPQITAAYYYPDSTAGLRGLNSNLYDDLGCDLSDGEWVLDAKGPLYNHRECPAISQGQNCQSNGRLDNEYEFFRWEPSRCQIPRFDSLAFLRQQRGKTIAFIGDSMARNQMESLVCILLQAADGKFISKHNMHRWYFPKYKLNVVRMWSPWLVQSKGNFPPSFSPPEATKLNLTELDDFAVHLPKFDITILSSGHSWIRRPSSFFIHGKIQGGIGWRWPSNSNSTGPKKIDHVTAFGVAMSTTLHKIATYPGYKGVTILRTFTPDHYSGAEDGASSCEEEVWPYETAPGNDYNQRMRDAQLDAFSYITRRGSIMPNGSKLKLLDVYPMLNYRGDGHPGSHRNSVPGKQAGTDCLHWCLPGPLDNMNEILVLLLQPEEEDENESQ